MTIGRSVRRPIGWLLGRYISLNKSLYTLNRSVGKVDAYAGSPVGRSVRIGREIHRSVVVFGSDSDALENSISIGCCASV